MVRRNRIRAFETLENRQVLSAHAVAPGLAVAAQHANEHSHVPMLISSQLHGHSSVQHTNLTATLSDATNSAVSGMVHFSSMTHHGTTRSMLNASITGAAANTTYNVAINGTVVGQITTDATGFGRLSLSSNPHGNQQAFPTNFPTNLAAGATVTIGTATGTLGTIGHEGEHGEDVVSRLAATLKDSANTSFSGQVKYLNVNDDGVSSRTLFVNVTGAAPNSTLNVSINGTVIGTLMTNASGTGTLVLSSENSTLPANFPTTLKANDQITVGTATGTLA